ncbi:MAG: sodium:alanine symporter family protein [Tissierellia bacterium]|nr:sodium:alanine symporter family protein [Tissierellia bacterium]MDD3226046.1 sodium:alanine symporter family protein [Tissierellia bacterium]MDD4045759.1 sodium:alanine symporter family protein [Tissierellia bacterium]MDD4678071.1 sodium:alanine symporter family protein [Tissierellia bacterium]
METLMSINSFVNNIVWGPPILVLIVGTGLYLSVKTGFFSITKLGYILKNTLLKMFSKEQKGEGEVTAFQAVATALAATVGTGNIAGVATAIALGGPGAIFWMWLAAIVGMTTKFAEVVLSVNFREKTEDGRFVGGPMYYIENGLGKSWKWLAVLFAFFGALASFGIGNMTQANSVAMAVQESFNIPPLATGITLAVLTFLVIVGGIKRIGKITEKLVPLMSAIYILGGLFILFSNLGAIPGAFALIFSRAFTGTAAIGGFAGSTMAMAIRFGIARGVFTNEAGLGSAPIAHAAATTDHPVRQGLWGVFEVFMDTIVICSITALAIITTGVWETGETGAVLTTMSFNAAIPGGGLIVTIGIVLFAFSTILGWAYYGERCLEYLAGTKPILAYRLAWVVFVVIGAIGGLEFIWSLADTLNGLMAIPNLVGVFFLSGTVFKLTKEFFSKEKAN